MAGGRYGRGGAPGRGGAGGSSKVCDGKRKNSGFSGRSGSYGYDGKPGRGAKPGTWLFRQFKYETISTAAKNSCACIASLKYKTPEQRVFNPAVLTCVDQQIAKLADQLPPDTDNASATAQSALAKLMEIDCPAEFELWNLESENNIITLSESPDVKQAYNETTCRCIAKTGKGLMECMTMINELNAERLKQELKVTDLSTIQSELALDATLAIVNDCAAATEDATVKRIREFSPVTGNCLPLIGTEYIGANAAGESWLTFEGNALELEAEKQRDKFTIMWNGCTAMLTSVTNTKRASKGDRHTLKILRASDEGFMGIYETSTKREMVFYKKRPALTKTDLTYRGQKFFIGQQVSVDITKQLEPGKFIMYYDPNSMDLLPLPDDPPQLEGTIKEFSYRKAGNKYWITIKPTGQFVAKEFYIDVEGAWDNQEFVVKN
jgi:hypothetical protein